MPLDGKEKVRSALMLKYARYAPRSAHNVTAGLFRAWVVGRLLVNHSP